MDSPTDDDWNCGKCTYINRGSNRKCSMCETDKPLIEEKPPPVFKNGTKNTTASDTVDRKNGKKEKAVNGVVDKLGKASYNVKSGEVNIVSEAKKSNIDNKKNATTEKPSARKTTGHTGKITNGRVPGDKKPQRPPAIKLKTDNKKKEAPKVLDKENGKGQGTDMIEKPRRPLVSRSQEAMDVDIQWKCPNCNTQNEAYFDNCKVCHTDKNADVIVIDGINANDKTKQQWVCRRCTLLNSSSETKCTVCEAPKTSNIPSPESIPADLDYSKFLPSTQPASPSLLPSNFPLIRERPDGKSNSFDNVKNGFKNPAKIQKKGCDGTEWTCKFCTFSCNPSFNQKCDKCGKEKQVPSSKGEDKVTKRTDLSANAIKQKLQKKTDGNAQNDEDNITKNANKGSKPKTTSDISWTCPSCTYRNEGASITCEMCTTEKITNELKIQWVCSKCTLLNTPESDLCSACGNRKGSINSIQARDDKTADNIAIDTPEDDNTKPKTVDKSKAAKEKVMGVTKAEKADATKTKTVETSKDLKPKTGDNVKVKVGDTNKKAQTKPSSKVPQKPKPTVKTDLSGKQCSVCTFINSTTSGPCKMCQRELSCAGDDKIVSPGTIRLKHPLDRQQSILMRELREIEDKDALELWQHITFFCKQVGANFFQFQHGKGDQN